MVRPPKDAPMPAYRIYKTSRDGHILGPALVIECEDDQTAITKAARAPLTELPQSCGKALGAW